MKKIIFGLFLTTLALKTLQAEPLIEEEGLKKAADYAITKSGWPRNEPKHTFVFTQVIGEPKTKIVNVNLGDSELRNGVYMKVSYDQDHYQTTFNLSREVNPGDEETLFKVAIFFTKRWGFPVLKFVGDPSNDGFQNLLEKYHFNNIHGTWTLNLK